MCSLNTFSCIHSFPSHFTFAYKSGLPLLPWCPPLCCYGGERPCEEHRGSLCSTLFPDPLQPRVARPGWAHGQSSPPPEELHGSLPWTGRKAHQEESARSINFTNNSAWEVLCHLHVCSTRLSACKKKIATQFCPPTYVAKLMWYLLL